MTYEQVTGRWLSDSGNVLGIGYSGGNCGQTPSGCNNPDAQMIHDVGPIPQGKYTIQPPQNTITHGPYVLPLLPDPLNTMYGRSGMLVHGDSVISPGKRMASEGCIILPRQIREQIWNSGDHALTVISGLGENA